MWIAAFDGIFQYDGKSFTNVTSKVSSARFFSVLEDSKGNFWFGSIGSGVYYYDGKTFQNFTIKDGLLNNEVVCIYEDKTGNIWFGASGGASRYDGKSFRNYIINGDAINEDRTGKSFSERQPYGVNSIIEDKTGKFWFGTSGNSFVYDGKAFTVITHKGSPFTNVRTIIEDKNGIIWLGGNDGLWRYQGSAAASFGNSFISFGSTFTQVTKDFVGYVYEDKKGNIWSSSETALGWVLFRYDENSLSNKKFAPTEIRLGYEGNAGMIFGILEASDETIWFGALRGVYRYDGKTTTNFKKGQE
jgi:ligand-binding sensor domain-containing protein